MFAHTQKVFATAKLLAYFRGPLKENRRFTRHLTSHMRKRHGISIYKKFDDGFIIRDLKKEELNIVIDNAIKHLEVYAHPKDVNMFWKCADPTPGAHFFAGEYDGQLATTFYCLQIGPAIHAASGSYSNPVFRGKSFWTRLHRWFLEQKPALITGGIQTKFLASSFQRLGWKLGHNTLQWKGTPSPADKLPNGIINARSVPFEELLQYDASHFLHPKAPIRRRLLQEWTRDDAYLTLAAVDSNRDILGYAVRRPALDGNFAVGPWYADDVNIAERLLVGATAGVPRGTMFYVENWEPNEDAQRLMEKYNFEVYSTLIYVTYGQEYGILKPWVFGVTSEDFCQA